MTNPQLSLDEIRGLAKLERMMDSGEVPYVIVRGHRASVQRDILDHLGLVSGQTVSDQLWIAMMDTALLNLRQRMEWEDPESGNPEEIV